MLASSPSLLAPCGYFFKDLTHFIFRQRGKEGERKGEKHQCMVASRVPLTRDLACNPGMCPDWEISQHPFGLQAGAKSTEPHPSGLPVYLIYCCLHFFPYTLAVLSEFSEHPCHQCFELCI